MEQLLALRFSYLDILIIESSLIGIYFITKILHGLVISLASGSFRSSLILRLFHTFLTLYEPIAIILGVVFVVFLHPLFMGIIFTSLFVVLFPFIRDYWSGKLLQVEAQIQKGMRMRFQNKEGIISSLSVFGLRIRTEEGLLHCSYTDILKNGYTLISGGQVGEICKLLVSSPDKISPQQACAELLDLFVTIPYIHWNFQPEILQSQEHIGFIEARFLVREKYHLAELITLLQEIGYSCSLLSEKKSTKENN